MCGYELNLNAKTAAVRILFVNGYDFQFEPIHEMPNIH